MHIWQRCPRKDTWFRNKLCLSAVLPVVTHYEHRKFNKPNCMIIRPFLTSVTLKNRWRSLICRSTESNNKSDSFCNRSRSLISAVVQKAIIKAIHFTNYYNKKINSIVSDYTRYAIKNKIDGIVCSPKEIKTIKKIISDKFLIITPGIRPKNYNTLDDQARTMTPKEAIDAGANYLVIGRPITQSKNPLKTLKLINASLT